MRAPGQANPVAMKALPGRHRAQDGECGCRGLREWSFRLVTPLGTMTTLPQSEELPSQVNQAGLPGVLASFEVQMQ